jgi:hypothetical protein
MVRRLIHPRERVIEVAAFKKEDHRHTVRRRRLVGHLKLADLSECMTANELAEAGALF